MKSNYIYLLAIAGLILFILLQRIGCGAGKAPTATDTVRVYMTQPRYFPVFVPAIHKETPPETLYVMSTVIDSAGRIDSSKCVDLAMDHHTTREYSDTLRDDTADVFVSATVRENRIDHMQLGYRIKIPITTVTNTYNKPRIQLFAAGNLGTDLIGFMAGAELILKDKRNFIYKAGVDFNTAGNHVYRVGAGFLISFRKNK